jgi:hypothetical protein
VGRAEGVDEMLEERSGGVRPSHLGRQNLAVLDGAELEERAAAALGVDEPLEACCALRVVPHPDASDVTVDLRRDERAVDQLGQRSSPSRDFTRRERARDGLIGHGNSVAGEPRQCRFDSTRSQGRQPRRW